MAHFAAAQNEPNTESRIKGWRPSQPAARPKAANAERYPRPQAGQAMKGAQQSPPQWAGLQILFLVSMNYIW